MSARRELTVIGKFKDEAAGVPTVECVGLRSKMYSYVKDNGKNEKTAKCVKKYVIKKNIKHEDYKDTLTDKKRMMRKMNIIRSECHQIGSYELKKISLSYCYDKRYIHNDCITTYAYGIKTYKKIFYSNIYRWIVRRYIRIY